MTHMHEYKQNRIMYNDGYFRLRVGSSVVCKGVEGQSVFKIEVDDDELVDLDDVMRELGFDR
jgi:hypothetical protein